MSRSSYQRNLGPREFSELLPAYLTIFVYPTPLQQFGNPERDIMKCFRHNFPEKAHKKSTGSEKVFEGSDLFFLLKLPNTYAVSLRWSVLCNISMVERPGELE
jgi:hypothetical protein